MVLLRRRRAGGWLAKVARLIPDGHAPSDIVVSILINRVTAMQGLLPIRQRPTETRAMTRLFGAFLADESGATAIEYGLIAAGISVAIITVVGALGSKLNNTFGAVKNALN
jgi:pilus assembly protein Flp/PilA